MKLPFIKSSKKRGSIFKRRKTSIQLRKAKVTVFKEHAKPTKHSNKLLRIPSSLSSSIKVFLIAILFIFLAIIVVYFGVTTVLRLRADTDKQDMFKAGVVIGFDQIPAYPGAEFVFDTALKDEVVKKFIGQGYSIYRLPVGKDISAVYDYYSKALTELGWKNVAKVEIGSSDKMFGQYWTKDGTGMRIFGKINDIWYQKLSESDANEGLSREVALANEKKLIVAQANSTSLLPNYPWKLSVPTDYTVKYFISKLNDLEGIEFTTPNFVGKIQLIPFSLYSGLTYDAYIDDFSLQNNLRVINSVVIQVKGVVATQATVTDGTKNGSVLAINNIKNNVVYIIYSDTELNPFLDYIKANLEIVDYAKLAN